MTETTKFGFEQADMLADLHAMSDPLLDALPYGVIGFDARTLICRYNATESRLTGLDAARVLGRPLFEEVAQCMNNYLVAQRFEDAATAGLPLDATIDYVLTWRMRPTAVRLRLLSAPATPLRYLLLLRQPTAP